MRLILSLVIPGLFIVLALYITIGLIIYYVQRARCVAFMKEYGLKSMPDYIRIKKLRNPVAQGFFVINVPCWAFSNMDGSRDRRRSYNRIVYHKSELFLGKFVVLTRSAIEMAGLVHDIRVKNGENSVAKNEIESKKITDILKTKEVQQRCNNIDSIINEFQSIPTDFEKYVAGLYGEMGYTTVVTPKTNDGGYDIKMKKGTEVAIVECKCFNRNHSIGRPLIQKLVGANQAVRADKMIFVTTTTFSKGAIEYAKTVGVEMIDGEELLGLVKECFKTQEQAPCIRLAEWELKPSDILALIPEDIKESIQC